MNTDENKIAIAETIEANLETVNKTNNKSKAKPAKQAKSKFNVGDRVGLNLITKHPLNDYDSSKVVKYFANADTSPYYGTIKEVKGKKAVVEWDSDYMGVDIDDSVDFKDLMTEADMKKHVKTLGQEFKIASKAIKIQMQDAAKIVKNANAIAEKHGTQLAEMYDAFSPLYDAMDEAGWNSSSFGC